MMRQSTSRISRLSSSRSLFSEDSSTHIPTDQVRDIAEQAKAKVRQQVEGFARAVLRDPCRPKRGSMFADNALKVLQHKDLRQDGSAEKPKRGGAKAARDRFKYKIRASPKQTASPGLSSVMNRVLKLNTPSMKTSSAKRKPGAKAKAASPAANKPHYLGEDEDNLLWELRKNDPGLMKDRYSLPTGKLRGARLGFSGDVVSNHSILLELERRGATTVLTESEEQEAVDAALRDLFLHNVQHLHDVVTETQCSLQILGSAHVHQHNTFASVLSTILTLLKRCSKAFQESELPANTGHDVADYELGTCSNKTQTMRRITALAMSLSWEAKQHQELLEELERKADRSVPFLRRADWAAAHSLYYALEEASAILRGRKAVYMTSEEAQQDAKEQDVRDTVLRAEATATTAQRLSETRRKSLLRSMSNVAQAAVRLGSKRNLLDTVVPEAMDIEATSSSTPRTQAAASTATMSASHTPNHTSTPTGLHRILALRARPASGASSASPSKLRRSLRRPEESPAETKQLPNSETKQGANSETKELPNSERKLAPSSEKKLLPASEKRFRSSASARLTPSSLPRADPGPASGEAASHNSPADFVPTRLRFPRLQKGLAACSMDGLLPSAKRSSTFLTDGASAKDKTRHELVRQSHPGTDLSASGAGEGTFGERRKRQAPARLRIQG